MHRAISGQLPPSGGWPELLADLKTFLETGDTMHAAPVRAAAGAEEPQTLIPE